MSHHWKVVFGIMAAISSQANAIHDDGDRHGSTAIVMKPGRIHKAGGASESTMTGSHGGGGGAAVMPAPQLVGNADKGAPKPKCNKNKIQTPGVWILGAKEKKNAILDMTSPMESLPGDESSDLLLTDSDEDCAPEDLN